MSLSTPHSQLHASPLVLPVVPLGASLSAFFAVTYLACIVFYLLFPGLVTNHAVLTMFLPWFKLLDWPSFLLGLVGSFGFGWYVALIFGPLFNFFNGTRLFGS